jgi:hypothetical protein
MLNLRSWNKAVTRYFNTGYQYYLNHSSQLQVVSTNQWPIPYYKRMTIYPASLYPETDYNVDCTGNSHGEPDEFNVYSAQRTLMKTMRGREILQYMNSIGRKGDLNTVITSPALSANVYTEDLLRHIDFTRKENARILKKHNFAEVFQ